MDYPGTTTYEPTLLHVALVMGAAIVATYPLSFVLMMSGHVELAQSKGNALKRAIYRANQIVRVQLMMSFFAWLGGAVACFFSLIVIVMAGGLLVAVGIMEPFNNVLSPPVIFAFAIVHVVAQGVAYREAVRDTAPKKAS